MKTALGSLHPDKRKSHSMRRVLIKSCLVIVRGAEAVPGAGDHAELTRALRQNHPQVSGLTLRDCSEDHILTL